MGLFRRTHPVLPPPCHAAAEEMHRFSVRGLQAALPPWAPTG